MRRREEGRLGDEEKREGRGEEARRELRRTKIAKDFKFMNKVHNVSYNMYNIKV